MPDLACRIKSPDRFSSMPRLPSTMSHRVDVASEENSPFPTIIDDRAASDPDRLYAGYFEFTNNENLELRKLTYRNIANAVNRCAWWLNSQFGRSEDFKTLAYSGPADLRYLIVTLAATKTGHKVIMTNGCCSADTLPDTA